MFDTNKFLKTDYKNTTTQITLDEIKHIIQEDIKEINIQFFCWGKDNFVTDNISFCRYITGFELDYLITDYLNNSGWETCTQKSPENETYFSNKKINKFGFWGTGREAYIKNRTICKKYEN